LLLTTREFIKLVTLYLPIQEPIYEFGSYIVPGQENEANLRSFFPGKQYFGCDMRKGAGVDLILNLHDIDLPACCAKTVLCFDTLEHVEYPRKAIEEMHRILSPDGILIISSLMNFPIHNHPYDYWRFTPQGFKSLLNIFNSSIISHTGEDNFPITILGIGFKGHAPNTKKFEKELKKWRSNNIKLSNYIKKNNIKIEKI